MPQFLRPDSNVTQTNWTNGFAEIDEATASDTDFSYGANNSSAARLEVGTSNPAKTPSSAGTCTVRWRHAKVSSGTLSGTGGTVSQTCGVYQGASLLSSSTVTTGGTWTAASFTFNASLVSDWTNLRLRFTQTASGGGGNARGSAVSWAELEAPDAAFALVAETGLFNDAGIDATLRHEAVLVVNTGSFSGSGLDATLVKQRNLPAETGVFALAVTTAELRQNVVLLSEPGAFSQIGLDATIQHNPKLSTSTGDFDLAGANVDISRFAILLAQPDILALTGVDAQVLRDSTLSCSVGSFVGTGFAASLVHNVTISADEGSLQVNGLDASFDYASASSTTLSADSGFVLAYGVAASFQRSFVVTGQAASFQIAGADILPRLGFNLDAFTGSIQIYPDAASFKQSFSIAALAGSISSASLSFVGFKFGRRLSCSSSKWSVLKKLAFIEKGSRIDSGSVDYSFIGSASQLLTSYPIIALTRAYLIAGNSVAFKAGHVLVASPGSLVATCNEVSLLVDSPLLASGLHLTFTGKPAVLRHHAVLLADTGHNRIKVFKSRLRIRSTPEEPKVYAGGFVDIDPYLKVRRVQNRYNLPSRIVQPTLNNPY